MKQYTQGEWRVEGDCYIIAGEEHKHSLICDLATANDDYEANAQLIASAPDLYEALKAVMDEPDSEKAAAIVLKALAKVNDVSI